MKPQFFGPDLILLDKIAAGGMAEVYRARQIGYGGFEKTVAVKRILPNFAQNEEFKSMFRAEANLSGHLQHPNIAQVFSNGEFEDYLFLVLEFVDGKNVRQMLARADKKKVKIPVELSVHIVTEAAKGLNYAHDFKDEKTAEHLEIVHRDMSPQNIMLSYDGSVKIVDFGIAKAAARSGNTRAGVLKGKFGYMSPEQAQGMKLDRRTDIFALGIILFELLTQRRLFTADDDLKTLQLVKDCRVPRPSKYNPNVPAALDTIVLKTLSKNPAERYNTSNELYADLVRLLYQSFPNFLPTDLSSFIRNLFAEDIADERTKRDRINAEIPARPAAPRKRIAPPAEDDDSPTKYGADAATQVARDTEDVTDADNEGDATESFNGSPQETEALKASIAELALPPPSVPLAVDSIKPPPQLALDDTGAGVRPQRRPFLSTKTDNEDRPKMHVVNFERKGVSPVSLRAAGAMAVLVMLGLFFVLGPKEKGAVPASETPPVAENIQPNNNANPNANTEEPNPAAQTQQPDPGVNGAQVAEQNNLPPSSGNQQSQVGLDAHRDPASNPANAVDAGEKKLPNAAVAQPSPPQPTPTRIMNLPNPSNAAAQNKAAQSGRGNAITVAALQAQGANGPNGFLILNSTPRATEIYINDKLLTQTDGSTLRTPLEKFSLQPGEYRLTLKNSFFGVSFEGKFKITADRISPMDVVLK